MKYLLLLVLPMVLLANYACTTKTETPRTIQLRAESMLEFAPNEADLSVRFSCLERSSADAQACLIERSNALTDSLLALGIDPDRIQTNGLSITKSYTWRNNSQQFEGYLATVSMRIAVTSLDRLAAVLTRLLEEPMVEVYGPQYAHSAIDSLESLAYAAALDKADALAEQMLESLPQTRKSILNIGNVSLTPKQAPRDQAVGDAVARTSVVEEAQSGSSLNVSNGLIEVGVRLYVDYVVE